MIDTEEKPTYEELAELLGRIVLASTALEYEVHSCLAMLLGNEDLAKSFVVGTSFDRTCEILKIMFFHGISDEKLAEQFEGLFERIKTAYAERNKFVHSHWWWNAGATEITRVKFRKPDLSKKIKSKLKKREQTPWGEYEFNFNISALRKSVIQIDTASDELFHFMTQDLRPIILSRKQVNNEKASPR